MQLSKLFLALMVLALASHSAFGRISHLKQQIESSQSDNIEFVDNLQQPELLQTESQVESAAEAESVDHHEAEEVSHLTAQTTASVAKLVAQAAAKAAAEAAPAVKAAAPAPVAVPAPIIVKVAAPAPVAVPAPVVAKAAAPAPVAAPAMRNLIQTQDAPAAAPVPQPGVSTGERQAESQLFTANGQLPFVNGPVPTPNPPAPFVLSKNVAAAAADNANRESYMTPEGYIYYYDDASHGVKDRFPDNTTAVPAAVAAEQVQRDAALTDLIKLADTMNNTAVEIGEVQRGQALVQALSTIAKDIVARDTSYVRLNHIAILLNTRNTELVEQVAKKTDNVKQLSYVLEEITNAINKAKDAVTAVATTSLLL